jgi:hypothetical protein
MYLSPSWGLSFLNKLINQALLPRLHQFKKRKSNSENPRLVIKPIEVKGWAQMLLEIQYGLE